MLKIILLVVLACIYSWIVYEIGYCAGFESAEEMQREKSDEKENN